MEGRLVLVLAVLSLALVLTSLSSTAAESATPEIGLPVTPDPAECLIEPRPIADFEVLVGTPSTGQVSFVPRTGEAADFETIAAVTATMREVIACINAGEILRMTALMTDAGFVNFYSALGVTEDLLEILTRTPQPLIELELTEIRDVVRLSDRRVSAIVVTTEPGGDPLFSYSIYKDVGGRYLVDFVVEEYVASPSGTPTALPLTD